MKATLQPRQCGNLCWLLAAAAAAWLVLLTAAWVLGALAQRAGTFLVGGVL